MKRFLSLISLLIVVSASHAQERITVGDILDLEERILLKQMTDELNKPNPHAPQAAPVVVLPKAPKIVYPTETLAVYGTSATFYEGQLSLGGQVYTVRQGMPVAGYIVNSVTPFGIELSKVSTGPARGKKRSRQQTNQTTFAPLAVR
jgi:hypothetical protein